MLKFQVACLGSQFYVYAYENEKDRRDSVAHYLNKDLTYSWYCDAENGRYDTMEEANNTIIAYERANEKPVETNQIRIDQDAAYLSSICGLYVVGKFLDKTKTLIFSFYTDNSKPYTINSFDSYDKAKIFAKGVEAGRKLND